MTLARTPGKACRPDYPHGDSKFPHAVEAFAKLPIPEASQARIVGEKWSRLYQIPLRKLAPRR